MGGRGGAGGFYGGGGYPIIGEISNSMKSDGWTQGLYVSVVQKASDMGLSISQGRDGWQTLTYYNGESYSIRPTNNPYGETVLAVRDSSGRLLGTYKQAGRAINAIDDDHIRKLRSRRR